MKSKIQPIYILILPVLVGMGVLALSTHHGPGIGGDATIYIKSAENLLNGSGLGLVGPQGEFRLIPYFPPFYSLTLAFIGLFGADLVQAAYWLNVFLFAGIIWLSGYTLFRVSRSLPAALLVEVLILSSPVLIPVYSWAMSEPLAIFLGFLGLVLLLRHFERESSHRYFYLSAVICGLAFLTRYAAVTFLVIGMAAVFFFSAGAFVKRMGKSLQYFLCGFLPMLLWLVIDWLHTSTVASRSVMGHVGLFERLQDMAADLKDVLLFWLIPDSWINAPFYPAVFNFILLAGIGIVLLVWFGLSLRSLVCAREAVSEKTDPALILLVMLGLFCLGYVLLTMFIFLTTYPPITIGSRMFAPMHVAVLWLVGLLAGMALKRYALSKRWRYIPLLVMLLFSGWFIMRSSLIVRQNYLEGQGYLAPMWQNSETIQAIREISSDKLLVTNEETAVLFLTGRASYALAEIYWDEPSHIDIRYGDGSLEDDEAQNAFRNEGAVLILFDSISDQLSGLYEEQTFERVRGMTGGLDSLFRGDDGSIFVYPAY